MKVARAAAIFVAMGVSLAASATLAKEPPPNKALNALEGIDMVIKRAAAATHRH
jgi:hypothetical protein